MTNYTILLPPSEGKTEGGEVASDSALSNAFSTLDPQRARVIKALKSALKQSRVKREKLFGVKGDALDRAVEINSQLPDSQLSNSPHMAAIERYSGVMFDFLDYATLSPAAKEAFDQNTILFSGVYGILRPTDQIADYKLKMDATLPSKRIGNIASFWKPHISAILNERLTDHVVWDLLPGAHQRAWDGKANVVARWQVKFVERSAKNGRVTYKTITHWSKALKGALIRFICEKNVTTLEPLHDFEHPEGYSFSPEQSTITEQGGELYFVRLV